MKFNYVRHIEQARQRFMASILEAIVEPIAPSQQQGDRG